MLIVVKTNDQKGTAEIILRNGEKSVTKHVKRVHGNIFRDEKGLPFNLALAR